MDTQENAQTIADLLNELLADDPAAAQATFTKGVPCNKTVAEHSRFIANPVVGMTTGSGYEIRILGILNGLFSDSHVIAAITDDRTGKLERFDVVNLEKVKPI